MILAFSGIDQEKLMGTITFSNSYGRKLRVELRDLENDLLNGKSRPWVKLHIDNSKNRYNCPCQECKVK